MTAGIDCGSSFCKGVLLGEGGLEAFASCPTGWNPAESGRRVLTELLENSFPVPGGPAERVAAGIPVAATGYGRETIQGTGKTITEISAHGRGAEFLCPGVRTVIDIGGQDSKVISVEKGRVRDFQMNDKCAAGSGRFLEMVRTRLDLTPPVMEELLGRQRRVTLNSTCVVFAESEIIGLLAKGVSREEILGGVADAMALRIAALAGRMDLQPPVVLTGGLSESAGIRAALSRVLGLDLRPLPRGAYAGAIGAALEARGREGL
ncbi:MAG: acyl-CoA dehydratase activase [Spirochaetaceae bacterium]|jgi:predicted CoA-substrate-specific enzyme activase|nr:acyl-CoA dehydratase activase [Spirochaetaceae bacterium]